MWGMFARSIITMTKVYWAFSQRESIILCYVCKTNLWGHLLLFLTHLQWSFWNHWMFYGFKYHTTTSRWPKWTCSETSLCADMLTLEKQGSVHELGSNITNTRWMFPLYNSDISTTRVLWQHVNFPCRVFITFHPVTCLSSTLLTLRSLV